MEVKNIAKIAAGVAGAAGVAVGSYILGYRKACKETEQYLIDVADTLKSLLDSIQVDSDEEEEEE